MVEGENARASCDGTYVDCTGYGGYSPLDPCKQTCVQPKDRVAGETSADTRVEEITEEGFQYIIRNGIRMKVQCKKNTDGKMECFDGSTDYGEAVNFDSTKTVGEATYKTKLAPNGQPWRYDCSPYELLLQDNCWNGASRLYVSMMVLFSIFFSM